MPVPVVTAEGVRKRLGGGEVLGGVDLEVPAGSITAVIGVNGAGKTTLLRILLGLARPDGGRARVLGCDVGRLGPAERERIGYVSQSAVLPEEMRVGGLMRLVAGLRGGWDEQAAAAYLDHFGLSRAARVGALSPGSRAQLALVLALAGHPDLLVLDEPAAGLDPVVRRRYLQLLLREAAAPTRTVLLASQDLALVERLCDRVALLHRGRIQVCGFLDTVLQSERRLRIVAGADAGPAIAALPGVRTLRPEARGFVATGRVDPDEVRRLPGVTAVDAHAMTLEDLLWSYAGIGVEE